MGRPHWNHKWLDHVGSSLVLLVCSSKNDQVISFQKERRTWATDPYTSGSKKKRVDLLNFFAEPNPGWFHVLLWVFFLALATGMVVSQAMSFVAYNNIDQGHSTGHCSDAFPLWCLCYSCCNQLPGIQGTACYSAQLVRDVVNGNQAAQRTFCWYHPKSLVQKSAGVQRQFAPIRNIHMLAITYIQVHDLCQPTGPPKKWTGVSLKGWDLDQRCKGRRKCPQDLCQMDRLSAVKQRFRTWISVAWYPSQTLWKPWPIF